MHARSQPHDAVFLTLLRMASVSSTAPTLGRQRKGEGGEEE